MKAYLENGGPLPSDSPEPTAPKVLDYIESADDFIRQPIRKSLLRYAIQRQMFCNACGKFLDIDDAVLVKIPGVSAVACSGCYEKEKQRTIKMTSADEWNKAIQDKTLEITDGRTLIDVPDVR
jgi:hypothetical protein